MILKGSQRANGADLAIHLMNGFDNERVEIAEIYGTVADDLLGAFAEMEVVAAGTRAKNYLYSLSINPSAPLTREQYDECIEIIEERLGLKGQPRAVVFHVKADKHGQRGHEQREHCHVVWSKIDAVSMKAIHMAYDHARLCDLSCELAHKYGLDLPPGLKAWEENNRQFDDKLEPSLAEKAQEDQTGITPEQRREEITACYEQADSPQAFIAALEQKGYVLARGDRRGFVIVDQFGNPHSLSRYVKGHKAKEVRKRLAPLTPEDLPTVDQAKEIAAQRRQAQGEKEREGEGERRRQQAEQRRDKAQAALTARHAKRRAQLLAREQELLIRQQDERLRLHAAQKREAGGILFRVRSAVADLIGRTPGLRSVLSHIQKLTHLDPKDRHQMEREALARRHDREKRDFERQKRFRARIETRERQALEKALKKAARQVQKAALSVDGLAGAGATARQDFYDSARDQGLWKAREFKDGEMSVDFNDVAEFVEGADRAGDDDDDRAPDWARRADQRGRGHRPKHGRKPKRGKGYGYRRGSD